jgi:hypothetical protein
MNIIVMLNGQDVTGSCLLSATRIASDSTRRITTASINVMGQALTAAASRYDYSHYDQDVYGIGIQALFKVTILDGRDGVTKLFDGNIYAMTLAQSDTPGGMVFYQCDLNDHGALLDRAVCWDTSFPLTLPNSDKGIILALLGHFCPAIHLTDIAQIVPTIQKFDWATKTCRQVLDDLAALAQASWHVDFDGNLHYGLASVAPAAPFGLSTTPNHTTTFPVRVENYRQDFTNPVNSAYVRGGADPSSGAIASASYKDPVSIQQYGEYATGLVDTQIATAWDAALKAKSIVLQYAYPIETGSFKIWGPDGLQVGMMVHIHEDWLGLDANYTIRAMTMNWEDAYQVRYEATFGAMQPDLETVLRMLTQRALWTTSNPPPPSASSGPPPPGSVTDSSIASPGLSATSIQSVNASVIQGQIVAGQIGSVSANVITGQLSAGQISSVNAGSIVGTISATQISSVSAATIQGVITAGQIGSVNATTIQGVVVSSQLADQIIDNLAKFSDLLRPIQMIKIGDPWPPTMPNKNFPPNSFFYYQPDGHFYQVTANGLGWVQNDNPDGSLMSFFYIGAIRANSITGLIVAAQIGSITAGQITGQIQASQIGSVTASTIVGQITAPQIQSINASQIAGSIQANQIASIAAGQITGTLSASQIQTVNATQITGSLAYNQIGSINAATITIGTLQDSQIAGMSGAKLLVGSVGSDKFNGYAIDVGGLANMPGRIRVFNSGGAVVAQMGYLGEVGSGSYGGWFQLFGAGGTSYGNAPIYTDTGGNLHITSPNLTNATLTNANISGSTLSNPSVNINGQILTSPQTFDATYGSLALQNAQPPDMTSFVSRGIVFYYNNTKIGSLVRSPNGAYLEMECTIGGSYVLINGSAGVRSDNGYWIAGSHVIDASRNISAGNVTGGSFYCGYFTTQGGNCDIGGMNCTGLINCGTLNSSGSIAAATTMGAGTYYCRGSQGTTQAPIFLGQDGVSKWQVSIVGGIVTAVTNVP